MSVDVALLTGHFLCHNPRVQKEAVALGNAGLDVVVLTAAPDSRALEKDEELAAALGIRICPVGVLNQGGLPGKLNGLRRRARVSLARRRFAAGSRPGADLLGYFVRELEHRALKTKAGLYIAHSEQALHAAMKLAAKGHKVGVDMEDWFSRDMPESERAGRPVEMLAQLESNTLKAAQHATCTSHAMSQALATAYGVNPPTVIYNAFSRAERDALDGLRKDRQADSPPSIHWYSQTIGPGRGLEILFRALPRLGNPCEVHLRGHVSAERQDWLRGEIPEGWADKVHVHGLVSNDELLSRIAEHDIGFAGELTTPESRNLTVTNKIMHYLLAGLAVVASNTEGQKEIAAHARGAVSLYDAGDVDGLAAALDALLANPDKMKQSRNEAVEAACTRFCWEDQAPALVDSVKRALGN